MSLNFYRIYACLPFVELNHEASIQLGPVIFWPASKFKEFIPEDIHSNFEHYLQTIGQIRAYTRHETQQKQWFDTVKLSLAGTTCISIADNVEPHQREFILIDAIYLLYFVCTFRNLYYSYETPSFDVFRKIIPASPEFIQQQQNWQEVHIDENRREETVCIHLVDQEICQGLGKILSVLYLKQSEPISHSILEKYTGLIRSIRYLVDRFFQRFVNLLGKGLRLPEELFEPEDIIFLALGFDALFVINEQHSKSDFRHKVRPLLHLKFSRPLELFWKWTDDFYDAKRNLVHGRHFQDPIFRGNVNFEVSHITIGIKLFIYSIYYMLFQYGLIHSEQIGSSYTLPEFKWIHPEEVLLFFWTEISLLKKIAIFLKKTSNNYVSAEHLADVHLLISLFVSMQKRFYKKKLDNGIRFIPTEKEELEDYGNQILQWAENLGHLPKDYQDFIPHSFLTILKHRLER